MARQENRCRATSYSRATTTRISMRGAWRRSRSRGPVCASSYCVRHRHRLEELAAPLRERGLSVTVDVAWDYPLAEVLVKRAAAERPWLVAKDAHHHSLLQRTLLTDTDWHLVRECPVPVLLVKRPAVPSNPVVLAAVDPFARARQARGARRRDLQVCRGAARSTGGTLHLVHAAAPPMGIELAPQLQALIASESRRAIEKFVETHPVARANVHVMDGLPEVCLESAVKQHNADFVVMGAVARRGVKKLLLGSTAARVLDRLPCDLVIIKPAELVLPS